MAVMKVETVNVFIQICTVYHMSISIESIIRPDSYSCPQYSSRGNNETSRWFLETGQELTHDISLNYKNGCVFKNGLNLQATAVILLSILINLMDIIYLTKRKFLIRSDQRTMNRLIFHI